jgi:hypothetical protein
MSEPLKRFQGLLRELFQFDSADLDFGIYRLFMCGAGQTRVVVACIEPM